MADIEEPNINEEIIIRPLEKPTPSAVRVEYFKAFLVHLYRSKTINFEPFIADYYILKNNEKLTSQDIRKRLFFIYLTGRSRYFVLYIHTPESIKALSDSEVKALYEYVIKIHRRRKRFFLIIQALFLIVIIVAFILMAKHLNQKIS